MPQAKYENLRLRLISEGATEVVMTFAEIERMIGAPLPDSARRHRAWWSNNGANNVAVRYWRGAGRKTAKVDMAAERLTFVKASAPQVAEVEVGPTDGGPIAGRNGFFSLNLDELPLVVQAAIHRKGGTEEAVVRLLEEGAFARRRERLEEMARKIPPTPSSSVDLIREDRDAH